MSDMCILDQLSSYMIGNASAQPPCSVLMVHRLFTEHSARRTEALNSHDAQGKLTMVMQQCMRQHEQMKVEMGVLTPLTSLSSASTGAPFSSRNFTTSMCPLYAATCSAVMPCREAAPRSMPTARLSVGVDSATSWLIQPLCEHER